MMAKGTTRRDVIAGAVGTGVILALPEALAAQASVPSRVVETRAGAVRGSQGQGVATFLGIPYGEDTAPRRFQPARTPKPWSGVRECTAFGRQSPQLEPNMGGMAGANAPSDFVKQVTGAFRVGMEVGNESEDCLVLNVYTPDASSRRKRPVMVWLHGGGFTIGSSNDPQYDGRALVRRGDVVVVTLNHRLNALGYLYLGALDADFADSGNVGQLDIVLALKWVRDNIAGFGGDPGNVTIFGESGGGAKVSTLLAMPPARGLFHKAIIQSGPGLTMTPKDKAADHAERTLAALGVAKGDVHKLQAMDYRTVIKAAGGAAAAMGLTGRNLLSPVVDGRSLPTDPFSPAAPEISRNIPIIVGTTKDEAALFLAADPAFGKMTEEQARQRAAMMLGDKASAIDVYKTLRPNDAPTYWLASAMTGRSAWSDSIRLAERKTAQRAAAVFMYRLDWETPVLGGAMKSPHGLDVPLVFDNADKKPQLVGTGGAARKIGATMSQAWINFARSGNPSQPSLAWPAYETASRKTMIFDVRSHVVSDPDGPARVLFSS